MNISELLVNGKHLLKDIEDGNIKARILLEYILKLSREKIVSNPNTGEWYLILMIYLDFVTFDESINFIKDFT